MVPAAVRLNYLMFYHGYRYINTDRLLHTFMDDDDDDDDDLLDMLDGNNEHDNDDGNPREKKRWKKRVILARRNVDGILEDIPPRESCIIILQNTTLK